MYSALIGFVFQSNSASSIPRSRNPGRTPCNFDVDNPKYLPRVAANPSFCILSRYISRDSLPSRRLVSIPQQVAIRVANS